MALSAAIGVATATDKGVTIVNAIVAAFRERNVLLPAKDVIERLGLAARAVARRRAEAALLAVFSEARLVDFDNLLKVDTKIERTRFHWIRSVPDGPSGDNLAGLMERLAFIRNAGTRWFAKETLHRRGLSPTSIPHAVGQLSSPSLSNSYRS